jgi:hypothetical protein
MSIVDRDYIENAKALADRIFEVIGATDDLFEGEIFSALMLVISTTLIGIDCPGCRQEWAKQLNREFPKHIQKALTHAVDPNEQELPSHMH